MPDPKFDQLPPDLSRLHKLLVDYFDLDGIRTLCFDLSVRYDDLRGETITAKVVALLQHLDRIKRIEALLNYAESKRPNVDWRGGPLPEAICPYKGLHAFGEADKDNFFGRDEFTKKLVAAVNKQSLVAVVGPSGSGKSSVVYAGLLPKLRQNGPWLIVHFRPGSDPFLGLGSALLPVLNPDVEVEDIKHRARKLRKYLGGDDEAERVPLADYLDQIRENDPDVKLLLIIDQFEELYTQVDAKVRRDFLDVVLAPGFGTAAHPFATLLLTMRADFLGQALAYPPMVDALQNNDVKIGLMSEEALTRAIEQPALNQGVIFAEGLVTRILEDVGDHAGNLPLLEFALTLLWERQTNRQMTHAAYEAIGGVSGALAQHADETLLKLTQEDPDRAEVIQRVMVQLVQPGAGAEDTRRVARRADLGDDGWSLVQQLAAEDARLLVTGREESAAETAGAETAETVEVIHEALIQNWGKLQEWMEQDREFRMWQERLRSDLALWQSKEHDEYLLRGGLLTVASEWLAKQRRNLSTTETEFIEDSLARQREREEAEEKRRQRELAQAQQLADEEKKARSRLRYVVGVLLSGLVIAAVLTVMLVGATQDAQENEASAVAARETSDANAVALVDAVAASEAETERAEKAEANAEQRALEAERALTLANARQLMSLGQSIFQDDPQLGLILALESLALADEIGEADGILTESKGRNDIFQWGRSLLLGEQVREVALFPNESRLLVAYSDAPGELRDGADGTLIETLAGEVDRWQFSPNESRLLVAYNDAPGELRDGADGSLIETLAGEVYLWGFSPNESRLLVAYSDAPGELRDGADGTLIATLAGEVDRWEFSPNESWLLVAYSDAPGELRDGADGTLIATLTGEVSQWQSSPNESWLLVAYSDAPGELRDGVDGTLIETLAGEVDWWEFSPNESLLLVGYSDAPGELRDGADGTLIATLAGEVYLWESSPNESWLLVDYSDAPGELRDGADGTLIATLAGEVYLWESSPNESWLLVAYSDAPGELRDGADGTLIETLAGEVDGWGFSPDESRLLVDYSDAPDELRDGADGSLIATLAGEVYLWESSPNESRLLVDYSDAPGELRDGADGTLIETLAGRVSQSQFSPNESWLLVAYSDAPDELRDGADGSLIETLAGEVDRWQFSPNESWLLVAYADAPHELRDGADGTLIATLAGEVDRWQFSPDESRLLVDYSDAPDELRDGADGSLIETLAGEVDRWQFSPNESRLLVDYIDGTSSLLRIVDGVTLAPLGTNLAATVFISTTQTMVVQYQEGQAYLIDLAWLEAMNGEVETLPLSELVRLACQFPLENGAVLDKPEVKAALEPYLQQVGLEAPQACQTMQ